ncbi:TIM21-domain-containing protein [Chytridium lagenaria]|nr:TIM21-domain-containing protein [Chytridium lagenaria]
MSIIQKVVHTTKNAGYLGIILFGVSVFGTALTFTGFNLIEDYRVNTTFEEAMNRIKENEKVQDLIGEPMEGVGDLMGPRGRASRLQRNFFQDAKGNKRLRMRFYLKGSLANGVVMLERVKDEEGNWIFDYLFVDVEGGRRRPYRVSIIKRQPEPKAAGAESSAPAPGMLSALWSRSMFSSKANNNKEYDDDS